MGLIALVVLAACSPGDASPPTSLAPSLSASTAPVAPLTTLAAATTSPTTVPPTTTTAAPPTACQALRGLLAEADRVTDIRTHQLRRVPEGETAPLTPEGTLLDTLASEYRTLGDATSGSAARTIRLARVAPLQRSVRLMATTGDRLDPEASDSDRYLPATLPAVKLATIPVLPGRAQALLGACPRVDVDRAATVLSVGTSARGPSPIPGTAVLEEIGDALNGFVDPSVLEALPRRCRELAPDLEQAYAAAMGPPRVYAEVSGEVLAWAGLLCEFGPPADDEDATVAHLRLLSGPAWFAWNFAGAPGSNALGGALVRTTGSPIWRDRLTNGQTWLAAAARDPVTGAVVAVAVPRQLGARQRDAALAEVIEHLGG
jgi:hypothetical protein